ncbi:MAG: hypothetical protein RSA40_02630 [Malacoplasma sp.]
MIPFVPKISHKQTLNYINKFEEVFFKLLKEKYNVINLRCPISTPLKNGVYSNIVDVRKINFDNAANREIYEFINYPDNWIRFNSWFIDLMPNDCIFSSFDSINRDTKEDEYNSIENAYWNFEIYVKEENRNYEHANEILLFFWDLIFNTTLSIQDIYKTKIEKNIGCFLYKNIEKKTLLLSPKEIIKRFILDKQFSIINNILLKSKNVDSFIFRPYDSYDFDNTSIFFVSDNNTNDILNLMEITFRPNWNIFVKQIESNDKEIVKNEFSDMLKKDNKPITVSVKINITNLFYFLLDKEKKREIPFANPTYSLNEIYYLFFKNNK